MFDYYAHDISNTDPARPLRHRLHGVFLDRWYPRPDLVIFLDAPAEVLFARKHEGTIPLLEAVLSQADFVSIHVPLNDSTRHLIDARALARMKRGAFLINMSRGGVVDEHALYRELTTEGRLGGAALDVHAEEGEGRISPLAELSNVVLTPHIGASTVDSQREIGHRIVSAIRDFSTDAARGGTTLAHPA